MLRLAKSTKIVYAAYTWSITVDEDICMADDLRESSHIAQTIERLTKLGVLFVDQENGVYILKVPVDTSRSIAIEIGFLFAQLAHPEVEFAPSYFASLSTDTFPTGKVVADYRESHPGYDKYGVYPRYFRKKQHISPPQEEGVE